MDESALIPSLSAGPVGSRFISQNDLEDAKAKREEQWKAAYARLGQEPPPQQQEDSYDGRSLAEKLAANKIAKQEEWEEKTKLANQFRALEEDEIMFLDSIRERQEQEERQRKEKDGEEVKGFKEAVAARNNAANAAASLVSSSLAKAPVSTKMVHSSTAKKETRRALKGVMVKKKARTDVPPKVSTPEAESAKEGSTLHDEHLTEPQRKRQKILR